MLKRINQRKSLLISFDWKNDLADATYGRQIFSLLHIYFGNYVQESILINWLPKFGILFVKSDGAIFTQWIIGLTKTFK